MPRKYFFALIAFTPSYDIRGPPESPPHESLPKMYKITHLKSDNKI